LLGAAVALIAGCSFPGNGPNAGDDQPGDDEPGDDQPVIDAPLPTDPDAPVDAAAPDARPDAEVPDGAWCRVETAPGTDQDRGRAGDGGGSAVNDLLCDQVDEVIVGIAIEMSNGVTTNDGRSARGLRIACAPVTLVTGGTPALGSLDLNEVRGSGTNGWSPSTWSEVTPCPAGWLVAGLDVYTGSGVDDGRFIDLTMVCAELGPDGLLTGARMDVYVQGSLDENSGNDRVECAAGEVLRVLEPNAGSGLDSVGLVCAQPQCG
jgi:hypothetical protein